MLLRLICLSVCVSLAATITCYDCYNTGPDHKDCTKERTCHGAACMIFDAGDNQTATAFCLLAMKGEENIDEKTGCWIEPDGKGKHCMCNTDFCNKLVDRRGAIEDPLAPLLPDAQFLKQNPLVDYEMPRLEDDDDETGAAPLPDNMMFPAAARVDPDTAGIEEDDDLVPIDFEEYDRDIKDKDSNSSNEDRSVISSTSPPSCVLMFLTMAASWARFFFLI